MAEKFRSMQHSDMTDLGQLESQTKIALKNQVDIFNATITRKAVIRYLTIVLDFSAGCLK